MELIRPVVFVWLFFVMTLTYDHPASFSVQAVFYSMPESPVQSVDCEVNASLKMIRNMPGSDDLVLEDAVISKYEPTKSDLRAANNLRRLIMALAGIILVLFIYSFRKYKNYERLNERLNQNQKRLSETVDALETEKEKYHTQYERMKQLLESISSGMWELNVESGELFLGRGIAGLMGYQSSTWNINNLKDDNIPVHPEDLPRLREAKERCMSGKCRNLNIDFRVRDSHHEYRWIKLRGCLIKPLDKKEPHKMFGIIDDIQEFKEAQEQRRQKEKALEEANKAKDKFFSIIAHDLKSPFNAILGLSDLLFKEIDFFTEEEIKEYASGINNASESAYQLLQNLLQWSRSQNGRIEFEPAYQNLHKLVAEVVNVNRHRAETKQITLEYNIPEGLMVFADRNMLYTVLHNLLTNAVKFTPRGKEVFIEAFKDDLNTEIHIKDQGVGIPKEYANTIFNIDNDYRRPGTDNEKGTGLGLVLCKEFVEKHGGRIWVNSKEGKGSDFAFTLPDK